MGQSEQNIKYKARLKQSWQSDLVSDLVSDSKPQAVGVIVVLCYDKLSMVIGQIIHLWLLRGPGYIKGFSVIQFSLGEGFEHSNLVPFNDDIKFEQEAIVIVCAIKIDILQSKCTEIPQFGSNLAVYLDVVVPEENNDIGYINYRGKFRYFLPKI